MQTEQIALRRQLDVRYYGQVSGGLTLLVKGGELTDADVRGVFASFHERHNEEFGYTLPEDLAELEIVNARVHAEGHREEPPDPRFAGKPDRVPKPGGAPEGVFRRAGLGRNPNLPTRSFADGL